MAASHGQERTKPTHSLAGYWNWLLTESQASSPSISPQETAADALLDDGSPLCDVCTNFDFSEVKRWLATIRETGEVTIPLIVVARVDPEYIEKSSQCTMCRMMRKVVISCSCDKGSTQPWDLVAVPRLMKGRIPPTDRSDLPPSDSFTSAELSTAPPTRLRSWTVPVLHEVSACLLALQRCGITPGMEAGLLVRDSRMSCRTGLYKLFDYKPGQELLFEDYDNAARSARNVGFRLPETYTLSVYQEALQTCLQTHAQCKSQQYIADTLQGFRLIDCDTLLIVEAELTWSYLALSYVWGKDPAPKSDECGAVDPKTSPAVIQDALEVTRDLGYRYLWIDRYCINTEDESRKMTQIMAMDRIYSGAQLTIFACAGDASAGLPGTRHTRRNRPAPACYGDDRVLPAHLDGIHAVEASKWASRGWTYQEEILSTRRLYFTAQSVYFECRINVVQEDTFGSLSLGVDHSYSARLRTAILADEREEELTRKELASYAARFLSYPDDTLNAVAGVLQKMSRISSKFHSLFGLPCLGNDQESLSSSLREHLCWVAGPARLQLHIAPSWTWAGLCGPVELTFRFWWHDWHHNWGPGGLCDDGASDFRIEHVSGSTCTLSELLLSMHSNMQVVHTGDWRTLVFQAKYFTSDFWLDFSQTVAHMGHVTGGRPAEGTTRTLELPVYLSSSSEDMETVFKDLCTGTVKCVLIAHWSNIWPWGYTDFYLLLRQDGADYFRVGSIERRVFHAIGDEDLTSPVPNAVDTFRVK